MLFSSIFKFLCARKKRKNTSKKGGPSSNENRASKPVSKQSSLRTPHHSNPDVDGGEDILPSEDFQSGDETPDLPEEDGVFRPLKSPRISTSTVLKEKPTTYMDETAILEKEWRDDLEKRVRENSVQFLRALQCLQKSVTELSSQLDAARHQMEVNVADLRAQMLAMQWNLANGIVQRDEHIAKLERQQCMGYMLGERQVDPEDVEPSYHLPYNCTFAPFNPPFFILRPHGAHLPVPDSTLPSYLQPPRDLDLYMDSVCLIH
ncbi:uncharacterized protein LOC144194647 [Stigmatopora nigra]